MKWFNCTLDDLPVGDFYYNGFPANYTMWLFIFLMMMYFMVGSFESEEMDPFYHKDEPWSHHPAYSINKQITPIVSKYQKLVFMWVRMGSEVLFLSLFTRFFTYTHLAIRLILFPLGALTW